MAAASGWGTRPSVSLLLFLHVLQGVRSAVMPYKGSEIALYQRGNGTHVGKRYYLYDIAVTPKGRMLE
jgi:hypothetical protein